jgi:hypothetical protein
MAQSPHLMRLTLTLLLFTPPLAHPDQDRKAELDEAGLIPPLGDPFGPAAFLLKRPLSQSRGPHILAMP